MSVLSARSELSDGHLSSFVACAATVVYVNWSHVGRACVSATSLPRQHTCRVRTTSDTPNPQHAASRVQQDIARGRNMVDARFQGKSGMGGTHNAIMSSEEYLSTAQRNFNNMEEGYYISPAFLDKVLYSHMS